MLANATTRQDLRRALQEAASQNDAAAILASGRNLIAASGALGDIKFCASLFAENSAAIKDQLKARTLRTFVVRSVTIEPILPFLAVEAVLANYMLDLRIGGFGSYFDELMNPASELASFAPDVALILLDLEDIAGRLPDLCADGIGAGVEAEIEDSVSRLEQLLRSFRSRSSCRLVVQGCVLPDLTSLGDVGDANVPHSLPGAVMALNSRLSHLCRTISDCVFFDVDRVAARSGRREWRDRRLFLASRLPVSANAFPTFARALVRSISSLFRAPRKVLCTDLDNTLWGGVLGEDGPEGIATGNAFPGNCYLEYQKYLKQLSTRGILLAAVSKNNLADVQEAFQLRAADLALTLDDFVATKIGWNDKSASLRALASELSLGLDSFVFVDDNPVECAAIRQDLPEVIVIEAPVPEPWRLVEILADAALFDAVVVTEDDLIRSKEYKAQAERAEVANSAAAVTSSSPLSTSSVPSSAPSKPPLRDPFNCSRRPTNSTSPRAGTPRRMLRTSRRAPVDRRSQSVCGIASEMQASSAWPSPATSARPATSTHCSCPVGSSVGESRPLFSPTLRSAHGSSAHNGSSANSSPPRRMRPARTSTRVTASHRLPLPKEATQSSLNMTSQPKPSPTQPGSLSKEPRLMSSPQVPASLRNILADILEISPDQVTPDLGVGAVDSWDSFGHLQLILAVESEFGVQFDPQRIPDLTTVALLQDELVKKGATL